MPYWVYILECSDGTFYTGITNNLDKRLFAHNSGKGAKYTRGRTPVLLRYIDEVIDKSEALKRELEIKGLTKSEKLKLFNVIADV